METRGGFMQFKIKPYVAARFAEILSVKQLLTNQKGVKLAFQKLPRHMRRRVMAHNIKRVPKSMRGIHLSQLKKSGLAPKQKRPSRKYRRRPQNLNSEIVRRQRNVKWLETHIWHAKRFKMITKWGYKIPYQSCDKSFRACYRASARHCLVQDISYVSCMQLEGPQGVLVDSLKKITPQQGLSIGAKAFINGNREGCMLFFKKNDPRVPIGDVRFQWKPSLNGNTAVLWLWVHAAYYKEILDNLVDLFDLTISGNSYKNEKITLSDLKSQFNRFRLTGPLAQAVLAHSLQLVDIKRKTEKWIEEFLHSDEERQIFAEQEQYWNQIKNAQSPAHLSPRIIISLTVCDPRYSLPKKRTKAVNTDVEFSDSIMEMPKNLASGALWFEKYRKQIVKSKKTAQEICEMRSTMLVPGSDMEKQGPPVPVMLIQRPGIDQSGYGCGWDIIIPKTWGQVFWSTFIMWGARSGGLRETENINFELGNPPIFPPDCEAGKCDDRFLEERCRTQYFKLPPNKRVNYNKFSIASPFNCNWKLLCQQWNVIDHEDDRDPIILRDKSVLETLQNFLLKGGCPKQFLRSEMSLDKNLLVPVKLKLKKGTLRRYSIICLPTATDNDLKVGPVERKVSDKLFQVRKDLRQKHKKMLMKLKKKRHAAKIKGKKVERDVSILEKFKETMQNLWLPEATQIRKSCSRDVIGFVTTGGMSFRLGYAFGIGFVPIRALSMILFNKSRFVLVRNTNSRQYRKATIEILPSIHY